jgi:hypothetical protein
MPAYARRQIADELAVGAYPCVSRRPRPADELFWASLSGLVHPAEKCRGTPPCGRAGICLMFASRPAVLACL